MPTATFQPADGLQGWGRPSINGRHHKADGSMAAKPLRPVVRTQGPPRDESGPILMITLVNESEWEPQTHAFVVSGMVWRGVGGGSGQCVHARACAHRAPALQTPISAHRWEARIQ